MATENVRKELTDLLTKCEITNFRLNATDKVLTIDYKEDFDALFPRLDADPQVNTPGYGTPYHFGKIAFFDYKGWRVQGWITKHKPQE